MTWVSRGSSISTITSVVGGASFASSFLSFCIVTSSFFMAGFESMK